MFMHYNSLSQHQDQADPAEEQRHARQAQSRNGPLRQAQEADLWILTHPALKGVARIKALTAFLYDRLRRSDKLFSARA